MNAEQLPNGNILIPIRVMDEDSGIIGDAMVEIGPNHPDYEKWDKYLKSHSTKFQNLVAMGVKSIKTA